VKYTPPMDIGYLESQGFVDLRFTKIHLSWMLYIEVVEDSEDSEDFTEMISSLHTSNVCVDVGY
jgi:hypothetical protein